MDSVDVRALGVGLRARQVSSVELTQHTLKKIEALEPRFHAFITVTPERALEDARRADAEMRSGIDLGPLHGIPYGLKDVIETAGIRTTCASRLLLDYIPGKDASVASRMKEAGGVLCGKLMTYEFAVSGPSFDLAFPPAINPRAPDSITGGSSSGCAAAVASGMLRIAVGTDGGGSARSPASYCGITGLKPTYGLIPCDGVWPLSASLDHVGPMGASVADVALCLDALAETNTSATLNHGIDGLRIGYVRQWSAGTADAAVQNALDAAAETLKSLGALVDLIELPPYDIFEACGIIIMQAEAYKLHAENLLHKGAVFGTKAFRNLVTGAILDAKDLAGAQSMQDVLTRDLTRILSQFDAMLVVNTLTPAPPLSGFRDGSSRWTEMRTLPFNVTGHPALALPMGLDDAGMPLGLQLVGNKRAEAMICRIGAALEQALNLRLPFHVTAQVKGKI